MFLNIFDSMTFCEKSNNLIRLLFYWKIKWKILDYTCFEVSSGSKKFIILHNSIII